MSGKENKKKDLIDLIEKKIDKLRGIPKKIKVDVRGKDRMRLSELLEMKL